MIDKKIYTFRVAGKPLPSPADMAGLMRRVDAVAQRLGVAGLGGDPPLSTSSLPDPDSLLDKVRKTRTGYVLHADQVYQQEMAPISARVQGLKDLSARNNAAWQLYRGGYQVMSGASDFLLAAAPAHRLVRWRLLPAVAKTLLQPDLPQAERDGLAKDLAQMQGLINQESADLRATLDQSAQHSDELDQEQAELDAEEHLVDVLLRMTTKQPVTDEELARAGNTYVKLMAATAAADGADAGDGQQVDRRGGGR